MILVDTSVWVDHLGEGNAGLVALLERNLVAIHPFVIGEIACDKRLLEVAVELGCAIADA